MSKKNNLKDYLTDLYEGIKKKRPNASRNPQHFRREIESISGGNKVPWDKAMTVIGRETSGAGMVFMDIVPECAVVQPVKYFLGSLPLTASVTINEINNLTVTKGV